MKGATTGGLLSSYCRQVQASNNIRGDYACSSFLLLLQFNNADCYGKGV